MPKPPLFSELEKDNEKEPSLSAKWRDANFQMLELPSGITVKVRVIDDETLQYMLPIIHGRDEDATEAENLIAMLKMAPTVLPKHVIEPRVVLTENEERKTPDECIWIEKIPLMDQIEIISFILAMDSRIYGSVVDKRREEALQKFLEE